jgi:hypothetical protein
MLQRVLRKCAYAQTTAVGKAHGRAANSSASAARELRRRAGED